MIMGKIRFIIQAVISVAVLAFIFTGCGEPGNQNIYIDTDEMESDFVKADSEDSEVCENTNEKSQEKIPEEETGYVYVQVCGAVSRPGVYKVQSNLRLFEVIDLAGGVTAEADTDVINMAKPVQDEMMVYVPAKDEISSGNYDKFMGNDLYGSYDSSSVEDDGLVNINKADENELMALPGIGQAKAEAIITYREENGAFSDISEIMNISGIKQAAFDKIKDLIKV